MIGAFKYLLGMSDKQKYNSDFALEKRLKELNMNLHQLFTNAVFGFQLVLSNYKRIFPEYTDHSELHALNVIDFCNKLIGPQITKMNADEIYILLMSCYFHDCGMGVFEKDYEEFTSKLPEEIRDDKDDAADISSMVRKYHNEYSGFFIEKYVDFFEIPSKEHVDAIVQVSRGHRKVDLMNEEKYPSDFKLKNGNTICLPYLASLIRLADEIDVSSSRNSALLFDMSAIVDDESIIEFSKHQAIQDVAVEDEAFALVIHADNPEIYEHLEKLRGKMQETLDYCRRITDSRTPYTITQKYVVLREVAENNHFPCDDILR